MNWFQYVFLIVVFVFSWVMLLGGIAAIVQAILMNKKEEKPEKLEKLEIKVALHGIGAKMPKIINIGDWIDLCAAHDVRMKAGEFGLIPLGVSMKLPEGYEAHLLPRSSTFKNYGILMACSMGIIDESYCGDNDVWRFPAYATKDTWIVEGERIAQFRIIKKMDKDRLDIIQVESTGSKDRGGFGSTGK